MNENGFKLGYVFILRQEHFVFFCKSHTKGLVLFREMLRSFPNAYCITAVTNNIKAILHNLLIQHLFDICILYNAHGFPNKQY